MIHCLIRPMTTWPINFRFPFWARAAQIDDKNVSVTEEQSRYWKIMCVPRTCKNNRNAADDGGRVFAAGTPDDGAGWRRRSARLPHSLRFHGPAPRRGEEQHRGLHFPSSYTFTKAKFCGDHLPSLHFHHHICSNACCVLGVVGFFFE